MDGFMPIKTGWDATREIREREAAAALAAGGAPLPLAAEGGDMTGRLVVIGVTGSATTPEDTKRCLIFFSFPLWSRCRREVEDSNLFLAYALLRCRTT